LEELYYKLQQHSATPLHNQPTVEALHAGTDSLESTSTELECPPKDSRGPVAERPENSPEVPETPTVALESVRRGDDDHSDDGNTLSHFRGYLTVGGSGPWLTARCSQCSRVLAT
jgi:hypothetical protein